MLTLNDGRTELWQWDTNRKFTVDADCSQVHFSNKVFGRSIDVDVVDGIAIIPDILLQTDKDLVAWAFVGTAENGYTKISKVFKVNKRNKPADYVFTPPEQTSLEEIKEKIEYLESIQDPDAIKNAVEDYLEQNPVESPVQSVNGYTGNVKLTAEDVGAISQEDLQEATNEALAQAKASGEFNGKDGKDGKDGYTPIKGVDYFDGQPGKDGADGKDGEDYVLTNEDKQEIAEMAAELVDVPDSGGNVDLTGYATEKYVREYAQPKGDYLESTALPTAINTALAQAKASGEFDGKDGADGAKGDKGDPGEKGDTGAAGKDGANGKTPVRGTDYWTDTDKTDMLNDVLAALPTWNGGSY